MANQPNLHLIKQAVTAAEANRRQSTSHTKTRGNVSGGGKKPWKQKGTGRARAGSSRSPIWVGGGITFGPQKERNFKQELPKKMARAAFAELLKHLQANKQVVIADSLHLTTAKTKQVLELLKKHNVTGRVVIVTEVLEPELVLAARNLPTVSVTENRNLSILDLAHTHFLLIDQKSAVARGLAKEVASKPATKRTSSKKAK